MLNEVNESSCEFLHQTIQAWLDLGANVQSRAPQLNVTDYVLWAQVLPVRCDFLEPDGVITKCPPNVTAENFTDANGTRYIYDPAACALWNRRPDNASDATPEYYADMLGIRVGGVTEYTEMQTGMLTIAQNGSVTNETFSVRLLANENHAISFV